MQRVSKALESCRLGKPLYFFEQVSSTNDILKSQAVSGAPEGCTVVADQQTNGRGRIGRKWLSLSGKGLYMSVLLRPRWQASDVAFISMLSSVAVADALERLGLDNVGVKWPNDVLTDGSKIAGVLVEQGVRRDVIDYSVVGIGVNVLHNTEELSPLGKNRATSCLIEGLRVSCDDVMVQVLNELSKIYYAVQHQGRSTIINEWTERRALNSSCRGQSVASRQ